MKAKAARQAEVDKCIAEQKVLFAKLADGECSADTKKEALKQIKALGKEADRARAWIKAKEAPPKPATPVASPTAARAHGRPRGPMSADFRPKVVYVSGASVEGLTEVTVAQVFRETTSAKFDGTTWVIDFTSRRAAESAAKAVGVLKRHFGPGATLSLSDVRAASAPEAPAAVEESGGADATAVDAEGGSSTSPAATKVAGDEMKTVAT